MHPRVFRQIFELGADQVTDGDQVPVGGVAAGRRLGGLDAAVEPFGKAVAEPGAEVFGDAVTVFLTVATSCLNGASRHAWPS